MAGSASSGEKRLCPLFLLLCLSAAGAWAKEPLPVAFYECLPCAQAPVLDGKLDDACWQGLPLMEQFYQYWTPVAKPPPLQTAARLCFDATGLYLGLTLYDDRPDKIRATISSRDDGSTWQDDCVEIMVDPANSGTGYLKFTTNFLAARYDEKVTNMVLDASWNAEGWRAVTSRDEKAWYIECSLPWKDLGAQPREGDLWAFDLVRYGYSSGSFRGVSWSLGGSYAAPQNFGYLAFGRFTPLTDDLLAKLAQAMTPTKGGYFRLLLPGLVLTHQAGKGWSRQETRSWVAEALDRTEATLREARAAVETMPMGADRTRLEASVTGCADQMAALRARAGEGGELPPSRAAITHDEALALAAQAAELKWEGLLLGLVAAQ